jgi:hypothetical protein
MKHKIKSKVVSLNIPLELKAWLDEQAAKERRSLSNLVVLYLEQLRAAQK